MFSIFDPSRILFLKLNWLSSFLVLLLIPGVFWLKRNSYQKFITEVIFSVNKEVLSLFSLFTKPGVSLIPLRMFLFIFLNNFFGLLPFVFTSSRHLTFSLTIALPLWLGHITIGWVKTSQRIFAHLVPLGTPVALIPFMVLIEIIRRVIRPITLAIRLAANIVAGHLLLCLLGGVFPLPLHLRLLLLTGLILLLVLEIAVARIQAYVFRVLSSLYVSEVDAESL